LSISLSPSASLSPSLSLSLSPSLSVSASPSLSPSLSPSASQSPSLSLSLSPSVSESISESLSISFSPSASQSPSASESLSISLSPSASASPSASESLSLSLSPSLSPSLSISPSPSTGYTGYSRGNYVALPANDDDLETAYSGQDVTDVSVSNNVRVVQEATEEFMIHEYKNFVGSQGSCQLHWEGQVTLEPSTSTVYLQIYNRDTTTWDTVDSDNTSPVDTDFVLIADVADLTNYKNSSEVISCRIYQEAL